jgi:hypothetical protein
MTRARPRPNSRDLRPAASAPEPIALHDFGFLTRRAKTIFRRVSEPLRNAIGAALPLADRT